nr:helix-turn-helix transcriptional regulator [Micromonospora eburnea]
MSTRSPSLIRVWRERLVLSDVGLLSYGRRRTKGLRREELAQLAGVSSDYITRLEQGRWQTPSPQVVASLARALQLDRTEADLLYRAAGLAPPGPGRICHHIPEREPTVRRAVGRGQRRGAPESCSDGPPPGRRRYHRRQRHADRPRRRPEGGRSNGGGR